MPFHVWKAHIQVVPSIEDFLKKGEVEVQNSITIVNKGSLVFQIFCIDHIVEKDQKVFEPCCCS